MKYQEEEHDMTVMAPNASFEPSVTKWFKLMKMNVSRVKLIEGEEGGRGTEEGEGSEKEKAHTKESKKKLKPRACPQHNERKKHNDTLHIQT